METIKSFQNGKQRLNRIKVFKRVKSVGITEEDVNNSPKLLQDVTKVGIKMCAWRNHKTESIEHRMKEVSVNESRLETKLGAFKNLVVCAWNH